ncbi:response regulator, partial [bacterium]|nr:response regulator [bacterium]
VIKTGQPKLAIVEPFKSASGEGWLMTDKIPYLDRDGETAGVVSLAIDITDRIRVEQELLDKEEELRQSQKMDAIGRLAGGIAHDFNNLLTAISGYTQLILHRLEPDDPNRAFLKQVEEAAERAAALTHQLLAFSRKQPVQLQVFQLNDRVSSMHGMLKHVIGEDIVLVTELEEELQIINADPSLLEQVMLNLVVNARDAMSPGGVVTIETRNVVIDQEMASTSPNAREGEFVCLSVRDTGAGMNKATLDHIFEPFFTTKEKGRGTGLGLSVVYGNVKQHKGWIEVDSEPGEGAVFRVYLPIAECESETQEEHAPIKQDLSGHSERILIVEDEDVVRDFACKVLRDRGYNVFDVGSAEEGLELYKQESGKFDAVFSDVVLPGKSGVQLVEELLSLDPELRILLSSGYTDEKSQWTTINDKGLRFLQKPYSLVDLLGTIREVLD